MMYSREEPVEGDDVTTYHKMNFILVHCSYMKNNINFIDSSAHILSSRGLNVVCKTFSPIFIVALQVCELFKLLLVSLLYSS